MNTAAASTTATQRLSGELSHRATTSRSTTTVPLLDLSSCNAVSPASAAKDLAKQLAFTPRSPLTTGRLRFATRILQRSVVFVCLCVIAVWPLVTMSPLAATVSARGGDLSAAWAGGSPPPRFPIAFHVLTTREGLVRYLHAQSQEWKAEVDRVGELVFSVGRAQGSEGQDLLTGVRARFPGITIQELDVDDAEYPPISKTLQAFELLSSSVAQRASFVYNLDDDTSFHPLRLAAIVSARNASAPLYMGRPLHNCLCVEGQPKGAACTEEIGTSYCSGAGYAFSSSSLTRMEGQWARCWSEHRGDFNARCRSSDTFVGLCMNTYASTRCSAASVLSPQLGDPVLGDSPATAAYASAAYAASQDPDAAHTPLHGTSWGVIGKGGFSTHIHTLLCQDSTHVGGVGQRGHAASPHTMTKGDGDLCAYMHPLKVNGSLSSPHVRYARFLMTGAAGGGAPETPLLAPPPSAAPPSSSTSAPAAPDSVASGLFSLLRGGGGGGAANAAIARVGRSAGHCRLALNIQSAPAHTELRNVIRSTWLRIAQAVGPDVLFIRFVIGTPKAPLSPHAQMAFDAELAQHPDDILRLPFQECYHCLYDKLLTWFRWALESTDCDFIGKVDDDVYLRVLPLLNYLAGFGPGPVDNVYFGMTFNTWSQFNTSAMSPVVKDPAHKWYMHDLYPHDRLPPFVTGNLVGLSRNLIAHVLATAAARPGNWRVDDAAVGIFVSELVTNTSTGAPVVYANDRDYFAALFVCTPNTVWDSPNFSNGFNMYDRYESDLGGDFCTLVDRSAMPSEPARDAWAPNIVLACPAARAGLRNITPPWVNPRSGEAATGGGGGAQFVSDWHALALDGTRDFGGVTVSKDIVEPASISETRLVHARALGYLAQKHCPGGGQAVAAWRRDGGGGEFMWLGRCHTDPTLVLLYMPIAQHAPAPVITEHAVTSTTVRIAVVVPAACFVEELREFLIHVTAILRQVPGPARIIVGWGNCPDASLSVHQSAADAPPELPGADVAERTLGVTGAFPLEIRRTGQPFSRSSTLNTAIAAASPSDLLVVLDTDMRITPAYFHTCRGVVHRGSSIYFPTPFSRFNPAMLEKLMEVQNVPQRTRDWYHQTFTVHRNTGHFVLYGYGMVAAFADDFQALGGYSANHTSWGMEDVDSFTAAKSSGLAVLRLADVNLVHRWHPKSCAAFLPAPGENNTADNASRYRMCMGTKGSAEGTAMMLSLAIADKEAAAEETERAAAAAAATTAAKGATSLTATAVPAHAPVSSMPTSSAQASAPGPAHIGNSSSAAAGGGATSAD